MLAVRDELVHTIDRLPVAEQILLFEIAQRFLTDDMDDILTADDLIAIQEAEREYAAGETVNHNDIDWD